MNISFKLNEAMYQLFESHQKSVGLVFKLIDNSGLIKYKYHFNVISYWQ
jgi:hypothetical protein